MAHLAHPSVEHFGKDAHLHQNRARTAQALVNQDQETTANCARVVADKLVPGSASRYHGNVGSVLVP